MSEADNIRRKMNWLPPQCMPEEVVDKKAFFDAALENMDAAWKELQEAKAAIPEAEREDIQAATAALSDGKRPPKRTVEDAEQRAKLAEPRYEASMILATKATTELNQAAMNAWPIWRRNIIDDAIPELEEELSKAFDQLREVFERHETAFEQLRRFDIKASSDTQHRPSFDEIVDTYSQRARTAVKSKPSFDANGYQLPKHHASNTAHHGFKVLSNYIHGGRAGHYAYRWAPHGDPARESIKAEVEALKRHLQAERERRMRGGESNQPPNSTLA